MHIEIQVALNFVISYLYNKLPRRRVNIFGEELEKALRDKFQGHWYPEKPFKGSAYRCLKTGDAIDSVLGRAARESGVPITDIIDNLPNELSVWVDPGEVSYRIGEKGAVKILYTEDNENFEDSYSADREVTKTFNPEAQCFRPIDVVNTTLNNLSLSPKTLPLPLPLPPSGSSPHSAASSSPTYKGSPNPNGGGSSGASLSGSNNVTATASAAAFVQRAAQAPLTFTTATFAQTKFGSTKLKTCSKRTSSSSYRMSPTEFSNYIKQRAMQQQLQQGHNVCSASTATFGVMESVSPARSLSPHSLALGGNKTTQAAPISEPFLYRKVPMSLLHRYNGQRNFFDPHYNTDAANISVCFGSTTSAVPTGHKSYNTYLKPCYFTNEHGNVNAAPGDGQQFDYANSSDNCFVFDADDSITSVGVENAGNSASDGTTGGSSNESSPFATPTADVVLSPSTVSESEKITVLVASSSSADSESVVTSSDVNKISSSSTGANNKINLSSFYGTGSSYQQLLVAN